MANFLLLFSYTAVSVNAMANLNEKVYDEQELMPMRSLPCFSTLGCVSKVQLEQENKIFVAKNV